MTKNFKDLYIEGMHRLFTEHFPDLLDSLTEAGVENLNRKVQVRLVDIINEAYNLGFKYGVKSDQDDEDDTCEAFNCMANQNFGHRLATAYSRGYRRGFENGRGRLGITLDQYQTVAMRTMNLERPKDETLRHAVFGLTSEAGEVAGILQKVYQGHSSPLENEEVKEHMIKELGDCLWMIAEAAEALEVSLSAVAQKNIQKLQARYPEGFDPEKSLHRQEGDV